MHLNDVVEPGFRNTIHRIVQENKISNQLLFSLLQEAHALSQSRAISHSPPRAVITHRTLPRQGKDKQRMRMPLAGCREVWGWEGVVPDPRQKFSTPES